MNKELPHWQHGLFATGILLVAIVIFYLVIIQPVLTIRKENAARIDDLSLQLNKFLSATARINQLKNEIKTLNNSALNNDDFFKGEGAAIVAADLQKRLKTIINTSGGYLVSTHAITGKDDNTYPKVTIKVHMQTDMKALQIVLYSLTNNKPLLFIDNLSIRRQYASIRAQRKSANLLEVRFDVTGYLIEQ